MNIYKIDTNKIETLNEAKCLIKELNITVTSKDKSFDKIKKHLSPFKYNKPKLNGKSVPITEKIYNDLEISLNDFTC